MAIVTKAPVRPTPVVNVTAIQTSAETAKAAALKMLEGAVIDDSKAPVEAGDKKVTPVAEEPAEEGVDEAPAEEESKEPAAPPPAESETEGEQEENANLKEEEQPAPPKEEKKGLPDPLKKSFEALAQEKKALRLERDTLKAEKTELAGYRMLDTARKNGDVMGFLAGGGFKYQDVVAAVTGGKLPAGATEDEPAGDDPVAQLRAELNELKESRKKDSFNRGMEQLHAAMVKAVDPKKYPNIAAEPELVRAAHAALVEHTRQTGSPPGENINESIHIALEAIETREAAVVAKWKKRLGVLDTGKTPGETGGVEPKSAVNQPASELGKQSKTLTNSHASTPTRASGSLVETVEELRAKAAKLIPD